MSPNGRMATVQAPLRTAALVLLLACACARAVDPTKWVVIPSSTGAVPPAAHAYHQLNPDWHVLVVAMVEGPIPQVPAHMAYLDVPNMIHYSHGMRELSLPNHPDATLAVRRLIGYNYAIRQHAEYIFDAHEHAVPTAPLSKMLDAKKFVYVGTTINPYGYFGHPSMWPRGFRLSDVGRPTETFDQADAVTAAGSGLRPRPLIRTSLTDGSPDVDALFRLTRCVHGTTPNITFEQRTPLAVVGASTYLPYSYGTMYEYDAFWALYTPLSVPASVGDIWRALWAQRGLRELPLRSQGVTISVHAPISTLEPELTSPAAAITQTERLLEEQGRLYNHTRTFLETLSAWKRPGHLGFIHYVGLELFTALANAGVVGPKERDGFQGFVNDIYNSGYKFPLLKAPDTEAALAPGMFESTNTVTRLRTALRPNRHPYSSWDTTHLVAETDVKFGHSFVYNEAGDGIVSANPETVMTLPRQAPKVCPSYRQSFSERLATQYSVKSPKVLLIVNYHWKKSCSPDTNKRILNKINAYYYNTPFDTVFMGPTAEGEIPNILSNGLHEGGYDTHYDVDVAYRKYPGYDGYLVINDDAILNQPRIPADGSHWFWQHAFTVADDVSPMCMFPPRGALWHHEGRDSCSTVIEILKTLFDNKYRRDTGGFEVNGKTHHGLIYRAQADMFYVPTRLMDKWREISEPFHQKHVFLEIAVPTIVNIINDEPCFASRQDAELEQLVGSDRSPHLCTSWGNDRGGLTKTMFQKKHSASHHNCFGFHPIKVASNDEALADTHEYYKWASEARCQRKEGCYVKYTLDKDGILWHAQLVPDAPAPL
eukprot:m.71428 g.71428  ORF g.71428 m.71428 type:complete len:823 (+) comp7633_c0_seq1:14-2482(+)